MKFDWTKPRYWYHISKKHLGQEVLFQPVENRFNRDPEEPIGERICVAPSLAHCMIATCCEKQNSHVYRTQVPMVAQQASGVFDASATKEGWFLQPTQFVKIGVFVIKDFMDDHEMMDLEVCGARDVVGSRYVLSQLRKIDLNKYILRKRLDNPVEPVSVVPINKSPFAKGSHSFMAVSGETFCKGINHEQYSNT